MENDQRNEKLYYLFQKLSKGYSTKGTIFLPEPQRTEELTKSFDVYMENRKITDAQRVAELFPEPQRTVGLMKVLEARLINGDPREAFEVTKLLPEPERTEPRIKILRFYFDNGFLGGALIIAESLPELQKTDELVNMLEECIKKYRKDDAEKVADLILKNHQK